MHQVEFSSFIRTMFTEYQMYKILGISSGKTLKDYSTVEIQILSIFADEIVKYENEVQKQATAEAKRRSTRRR